MSQFQIRVVRLAQFQIGVTWTPWRGGLGQRSGWRTRRSPRAVADSDWTARRAVDVRVLASATGGNRFQDSRHYVPFV